VWRVADTDPGSILAEGHVPNPVKNFKLVDRAGGEVPADQIRRFHRCRIGDCDEISRRPARLDPVT
jgi:hypothetical protein